MMGIVSIEDELHEQLRKASKASYRSINAQAAFWIRIGMLCELNPGLTFQEIVARELRDAGVDAGPGERNLPEPARAGLAAK